LGDCDESIFEILRAELIIIIIDILTRSPHHKEVVFSGALHKINNKYDKNDLKVKVKNRGCKN